MSLLKLLAIITLVCVGSISAAAQDKSTGGFKGKIHVESGSPSGVSVVVRQADHEVARTTSNRNGEFEVQKLAPGFYGITFRKPGLSVGTLENLEVKAGKVRTLPDRLVLSIDAGSITFLRGSVFDEVGRSLPNVRVELARVLDDGSLKKLDSRVTNETGSFVFRLTADTARYRVTARAEGREPASKDVDIDSAAVYRIALSLAAK